MSELSASEMALLKWLATEDYSQYGECCGKDLDALVAAGLAQLHGPNEHQSGFIAKGASLAYRAVSLTEAGWRHLAPPHSVPEKDDAAKERRAMTTQDIVGLVERLRKRCNCNPENPCGAEEDCELDNLAAATLVHLAGENARLREALRWYYLTTTWPEKHTTAEIEKAALDVWTILQEGFNARAALGDTPAGLDRQGPLEE